jgi:hypothetical protein
MLRSRSPLWLHADARNLGGASIPVDTPMECAALGSGIG